MMYRAGPAAPGLPFPRKSLGLYTALAIVAAVVMVLLPFPMFAHAAGWRMFKEGGAIGMSLILLASVVAASAIAIHGAFAVRGKRLPMIIIGAIPALPLLMGALFYRQGVYMTLHAVSGESVDPAVKFRIFAQGISEADACLVFGCLMGAAACGAASIALLGSAASVDRTPSAAPASNAWIGSLILGIVGILVMLVLRFSQKAHFVFVLLLLPSMILVTVLACTAARHGKLVAGWHDKAEANAWISALLAAAILACAGIVLLDVTAAIMSERVSLGAVSGESVDPSQRARILYEGVHEGRAATTFAVANGIFTFATVVIGVFGALGKGPDGSLRAPTAPSPWVALGGIVLSVLALVGCRATTWASVERAAAHRDASLPKIELPKRPTIDGFREGEDGVDLVVLADGSAPNTVSPSYRNAIVVMADKRATWGAVAKHIRATTARRSSPEKPSLSIGVELDEKPNLEPLGRYAVFVGPTTRSISVAFETSTFRTYDRGYQLLQPKATDDMQSVVNQMKRGSSSYDDPARIVLLPPDGSW